MVTDRAHSESICLSGQTVVEARTDGLLEQMLVLFTVSAIRCMFRLSLERAAAREFAAPPPSERSRNGSCTAGSTQYVLNTAHRAMLGA